MSAFLAPGHSPASLCFYNKKENFVIAGDVLFEGSIGRTDLPGGNYDTLISSIKTRLYPLGNQVMVYPGHGGSTTIGQERLTNPFKLINYKLFHRGTIYTKAPSTFPMDRLFRICEIFQMNINPKPLERDFV